MASTKKSQRRRGAAAVEAALTLPILFLLIFSGWELSRVNMIRNSMDNAAYNGARESMLPGATAAKVTAAVNDSLGALGIQGAVVDVTPSVITLSTDVVTVGIDVPLDQNTYGISTLFLGRNLESSCRLSRELQPGQF